MRTITARFNSKCHATGQAIKRGELITYDPDTKRAYKLGKEPQETDEESSLSGYIQAQEDAAIANGNY